MTLYWMENRVSQIVQMVTSVLYQTHRYIVSGIFVGLQVFILNPYKTYAFSADDRLWHRMVLYLYAPESNLLRQSLYLGLEFRATAG